MVSERGLSGHDLALPRHVSILSRTTTQTLVGGPTEKKLCMVCGLCETEAEEAENFLAHQWVLPLTSYHQYSTVIPRYHGANPAWLRNVVERGARSGVA